MHEVLVNPLRDLSLPRKSVVRLTDLPDMTLDVYRGRKTTTQQQQQILCLNEMYSKLFNLGFEDNFIDRECLMIDMKPNSKYNLNAHVFFCLKNLLQQIMLFCQKSNFPAPCHPGVEIGGCFALVGDG